MKLAPAQEATDPTDADGAPHRRLDVQGLRALAVVLVVAFHAGLPLPGGFTGVDVFFVISGFVITSMLLRQDAASQFTFAGFYTRRIRRLLPALACTVSLVAILSLILLSPFGPQEATARTGIGASLFSANFQLLRAGDAGYFGIGIDRNALLHTWSLSVEEQFYLLFPAVLVAGLRWSRRRHPGHLDRRVGTAAVGVVAIGSFACSYATSFAATGSDATRFAFYSPATRAWEFAIGGMLALGEPAIRRLVGGTARWWAAAGLVLVVGGAMLITESTPFPGLAALAPVFGTALILAAGSADAGALPGLRSRPVVRIGDMSYSWYLWHWPFIVFTAAIWPGNSVLLAVAAVVSLLPAHLSYQRVEQPIRSDARLVGRRLVVLVAICIVVPIIACVVLLFARRAENHLGAVAELRTAAAFHADLTRGCDSARPLDRRPLDQCRWNTPKARGTIYLVGDSNAGHLVEPVVAAGRRNGYAVRVATFSGCPFADVIRRPVGRFGGRPCRRFVRRTTQALADADPSLVVIASSSSEYLDNSDDVLVDPSTGRATSDRDGKSRIYERGLRSVLRSLREHDVPVLMIHPVPHFGTDQHDWELQACPMIRILTHSCADKSISRSRARQDNAPAVRAETDAARGISGISRADLSPQICTATRCAARSGRTFLYRNATHLSVPGSLRLTDRLQQLIARTAREQPPGGAEANGVGSTTQ